MRNHNNNGEIIIIMRNHKNKGERKETKQNKTNLYQTIKTFDN
jgi:hypothetical protein